MDEMLCLSAGSFLAYPPMNHNRIRFLLQSGNATWQASYSIQAHHIECQNDAQARVRVPDSLHVGSLDLRFK